MSKESPGARAVEVLQLEDIFLTHAECWVTRDFNPSSTMTDFTFGHQSGIEGEVVVQQRAPADGKPVFNILRYLIRTEVKLLKPGVKVDEREPTDDEILANLRFTLATDYRCPQDFWSDTEAVASFGRNAHFHAWPYIREEVHATCARLRIPRITMPMLRPDGKALVVEPIPAPASAPEE